MCLLQTGDFNSIPRSLALSILRDHTGLTDAWDLSRNSTPLPPPGEVSAEDAIRIFGITADSPLNSYTAQKALEDETKINHGKRLDYIFYRGPLNADTTTPSLRCSHSLVVFTDLVPGTNYSYSDHFGVEATLMIDMPGALAENKKNTNKKSMRISDEIINVFRQILVDSHHSAELRYHNQLSTFVILLAALVVISTISSFNIGSLAKLFLNIVTIAFAWAATTMLYVGFVFGRWEMGAIVNVLEELDILQNHINS